MKYYKVKAKCGHVGRNNYILKDFFVTAKNGKEAALIVRYKPRVKHDHKDAIKSVKEIPYIDYQNGNVMNRNDPYFNVKNSSEQKKQCIFEEGQILKEEEKQKRKNSGHIKQRLIELITIKEWRAERGLYYE